MKVKKTNFAGFEGAGRTKHEALDDLHQQVQRAVEGDYTPTVLQSGKETVVVWREPHSGWVYAIIHPGVEGCTAPRFLVMSVGDREKALRAAKLHLAQVQFSASNPDVVPSYLVNPSDISKYRSWASWQCVYAKAKQEGLGDQACRDQADSCLSGIHA